MTTVRTLLAIIAMYNLQAFQMDLSNALLHGDLEEKVCMTLPPGYTEFGSEISPGQVMTTPTRGESL